MGRRKIAIVGSGNVGATAAFLIVTAGLGDVALIDIAEGIPQGKALDILQALPLLGVDAEVKGSNDFKELKDSAVVIVAAGFPRQPGMTRLDLLKKNAQVVSSIITEVKRYAPNSFLIIVTNPLDIMTYLACKLSAFSKNRVMGMGGILDGARMKTFLAHKLRISVQDISTLVTGTHGEEMLPLVSKTTVGGVSVEQLLPSHELAKVIKETKGAGTQIVSYLKTGSAFYAPAAALLAMVKAIFNDEKRLFSLCCYLEGEYGYRDLCLNLPVILGAQGIEKIVEFPLTPDEEKGLDKAARSVKRALGELGYEEKK